MTNKKLKCIIIHGCPSDEEKAMDPKTMTYDKHWLPWTKKELEKIGIKTEIPLMPSPWAPVYENFKSEFEKLEVNENTILIGHSCGCAFLVRWLSESRKEIYKLILVAPWKVDDYGGKDKYREEFYGYQIDNSIKERVKKIIMFTSNNEDEEGKQSLKIFHKAIGGNIINLDNHGHYCLGDMGTKIFPELLEVIIK